MRKYPIEQSIFENVRIKLIDKEEQLYQMLGKLFAKLQKDTGLEDKKLSDDDIQKIYDDAVSAAHELIKSLSERKIEIQWSECTKKNRIAAETFDSMSAEFLRHYHVLEDLLHFIQQGKAFVAENYHAA